MLSTSSQLDEKRRLNCDSAKLKQWYIDYSMCCIDYSIDSLAAMGIEKRQEWEQAANCVDTI